MATVTASLGSGVLSGETVGISATNALFDTRDAGTDKTVTADLELTGADAVNYTLNATATTTANITAAPLTVSGITAEDKPFDGTTAATLNTGPAALDGVIGSDVVILSVAGADGNFETADVGSKKTVFITGLTISGAGAGNYTLVQPTTTASIT
jgi:hypothetical protein